MDALALLLLLFAPYFLPSLIAGIRHHHNTGAVFVLNLLLGWTLVGWVAAMVWAHTRVRQSTRWHRPCEFCREPVHPRAVVCPHCRNEIPLLLTRRA
jgi:hypothetical protein